MKYDFDQLIERRNTQSFKWDYLEELYGASDLIPLWVADMDFPVPDEVAEAIKGRAEHAIYGYTGISPEMFEALINWQKKRHGWEINKEWIGFSAGVVSGLNLVVQAYTKPGDQVIIQPPVYRPFQMAIENNGRQVVENPLKFEDGRYHMDFLDLESKFTSSTRMLILCNPHNPGGRVWSKAELEQLGEICIKHDVVIVADEIHADFVYSGVVHTPLASISPTIQERTVTCLAPNKTFNLAGLATSVVIISNKRLREEYLNVVERNGVKTNLFGLIAMEAAYKYGEAWLEELLPYLEDNLQYLLDFFKTRVPQIKPVKPDGTYLVWLDCRDLNMTQEELTRLMTFEAKVALNDGSWFGTGGEGFLRINIGCPRSILQEGLERIEKAVQELHS